MGLASRVPSVAYLRLEDGAVLLRDNPNLPLKFYFLSFSEVRVNPNAANDEVSLQTC